ncbi:MAG: hypothetical protein NT003_04485 [Candidatus Magasanikbacteria bacterium]|nr:hypothetical protein [Candidatus Magasanikbacteria bacterium]
MNSAFQNNDLAQSILTALTFLDDKNAVAKLRAKFSAHEQKKFDLTSVAELKKMFGEHYIEDVRSQKKSAPHFVDDETGSPVSHEFAHRADWNSKNDLEPLERLELLFNIAQRVQTADRYKSIFVESCSAVDAQINLRLRCQEYFAEITRAYFLASEELHMRDFIIIDHMRRSTFGLPEEN